MQRFAVLAGVTGLGISLIVAAGPQAQTANPQLAAQTITQTTEEAAHVYRVAVMQIFKRHMMALDIAAKVDSPLDYNLVIHARALRETARMLEELPVPKVPAKDTDKFSFADQRDFLQLVSKGIDAADEVYVGARLIRFDGRGRFDQALIDMRAICAECHRSFREPYRKLQE